MYPPSLSIGTVVVAIRVSMGSIRYRIDMGTY